MAQLTPEEEEWREVYERLCERFPSFTRARVLEVLRKYDGHAGQTAAALRDLSGTSMRPVDPDDAEHVRTLLSSPMMFGQACKEKFREFDKNGDGVLDLSEVLHLTTSLYENFGLEAPREGSLRAFFEANDANHDGVLNEKEFNKFFEMFLRYAFFDVVNHQEERRAGGERQEEEAEEEDEEDSASRARALPSAAEQDCGPTAAATNDRRTSPTAERGKKSERQHREHHGGRGGAFRCLAQNGVTYRSSADLQSRIDRVAQKGETVQATEFWIRTADGWLPLVDGHGQMLFEKVHGDRARGGERGAEHQGAKPRAMETATAPVAAPTATLLPQRPDMGAEAKTSNPEGGAPSKPKRSSRHPGGAASERPKPGRPLPEDWKERAERLCERFPEAGADRVAQALHNHSGHAGQAAKELRDAIG